MKHPLLDSRARKWVIPSLLALILLSSLGTRLVNLGHAGIKGLDESFHALVARNLLDDPLKPTLIQRPYLNYDRTDWLGNHVWLHKPVLPLWQIALSFFVLGVNTLALRIPSLLLSTGACALTYLIGRDLIDRRAGLVACAVQAFNPAILMLINGYAFSDHIDIALLFWTELSIWLMCITVTRATRPCPMPEKLAPDLLPRSQFLSTGETPVSQRSALPALLCGAAQGCAFLSKTWLAFIVTGLAVVVLIVRRDRQTLLQVALILLGTLLVAGPWMLYTWLRFPQEFLAENGLILKHLSEDVENWSAPWDRLCFDYLLRGLHRFYVPCVVALVIATWRVVRERDLRLGLLVAWVLGVVVTLSVATSKTPSGSLIAWPGMLLLLGWMTSRADDGDRTLLGAWLVSVLLGAIIPGKIPDKGWGYPELAGFAGVLRENIWVVWHVLASLLAALALSWIAIGSRVRCVLIAAAAIASLWLLGSAARVSWKVTQINDTAPSYRQLAAYARDHLPDNTVFLIEEQEKLERNVVMFWTGRTCYSIGPRSLDELAREVSSNGGIPLVISHRELPLELVTNLPKDQRVLYRWSGLPPSEQRK